MLVLKRRKGQSVVITVPRKEGQVVIRVYVAATGGSVSLSFDAPTKGVKILREEILREEIVR